MKKNRPLHAINHFLVLYFSLITCVPIPFAILIITKYRNMAYELVWFYFFVFKGISGMI